MNASSPSFRLIELTIGLPCTHFRPASMTVHLDESIISGTREISGSAAIRFRKRTMAASESSMAFVHVDVDDLRAVLDLLARDLERGFVSRRQDQLA